MLSIIALFSVILGVTITFRLVSQGGLSDENRAGVVLATVMYCFMGGMDVFFAEMICFDADNRIENQQQKCTTGEDGTRSCP